VGESFIRAINEECYMLHYVIVLSYCLQKIVQSVRITLNEAGIISSNPPLFLLCGHEKKMLIYYIYF
jgi:hypothetical protein